MAFRLINFPLKLALSNFKSWGTSSAESLLYGPHHHIHIGHLDIKGLGPAVKNYLKQYGLEPNQIKGTGPHGLLTKGDVLSHVQSNNVKAVIQEAESFPVSSLSSPKIVKTAPESGKAVQNLKKGQKGTPASFIDLEVTNMRRTIAKRLLESKSTIPHSYGTAECDVKNLGILRKKLATEGIKVSVNDLLIKCAGNALSRVPSVNCVWEGDMLTQRFVVDVSVAVATPNGLITPIVFNVGDLDIIDINQTVKELAGKARDGKLKPNEFMGGTFSISNLGMFGIHSFSAIINPPQCGILAVGGNIPSIDKDGKPKTTCKLTLSYDRRAIDEEQASKFLAILRSEIENANELSMGIYNLETRKESIETVASKSK